jgi:nitroimidazol reductase NimA-like FMN-containing flavoprotein (pyridoxamine 5'-phosphate oxidase superfamily)
MIEILEMSDREIRELLATTGYGHLACSKDGVPYIVPIHYAYDEPYVYVYTTEGKKSDIIAENPNVCLQIESVVDNTNWKSVIVTGRAEHLDVGEDREKALSAIVKVNPSLTPAVSVRWMDNWVKENIEVVYRIVPTEVTGKKAGGKDRPVIPGKTPGKPVH